MPAPRLESLTGRPEPDARNIQRALDAMRASADGGTYTPANASHWSGTPPTTIAAALDRIAAMLGPIT